MASSVAIPAVIGAFFLVVALLGVPVKVIRGAEVGCVRDDFLDVGHRKRTEKSTSLGR